MNSKKVNWFFLTTILLHILIVVLVVVFRYVFVLDIILNFIVSSAIIVVPALFFLLHSKENWKEALGFRKIKWSSAGMIVLFTFLTMPLTTFINAFSLLFVDNAVAEMSDQIFELSFPVTFFFMAISGPLCEEIAFRGVVYRGYRRSGTILQAILFSALLFALKHMNFNQAAYAFVIGIMLALLVEACGSLWASVIYHIVFNGYTVCVMYLTEWFQPGMLVESNSAYNREVLLYAMAFYAVIAAVSTAIAGCVLVWIAKNQKRRNVLKSIWAERKTGKGKMVTIPLVIAIVLCVAYIMLVSLTT